MPRTARLSVFVLIFLLAAAGRILNIDAESLWVDEGFSYWAIRHPDMLGLILRDVHPPLYFIGLRGWAGVAGITELALRYFSVLPSLLSVAVIYHVGRELARLRFPQQHNTPSHTLIPIFAMLLLALADMESYIAQETRMYTWHVLWAVCSMAFFLRWARLGTRRLLILWGVASLLLVYTHYIGVCLLAVQGLYALLFLRGRWRVQAVGMLAAVGLVFIPWLLVVVSGQTANIGTGFNVPSTLASLWNWRIEWFTGQWALMIGLAVLGLVVIHHDRPAQTPSRPYRVGLHPIAPAFLMLMWLLIPVALTYILNFYTPILMDYRITQITPAVALLVAFGLGNFRPPMRSFLLVVIVVYGVTTYDTPRPRPPWRQVGMNAAEYAVSGDLAVAHVTPSGDWQVMYYYERFMPEGVERRSLRQWQLEGVNIYAESPYETGFPALLAEHPHVWLMHWSSDVSAFAMLAESGHVQTAVMTEDWLGNALNVYRFDRLPPGEVTMYTSGMILRHARIHPETLQIDLFWAADGDNMPDRDYTVSVILLDNRDILMAQNDSPPFSGLRPTTTWTHTDIIYDTHKPQPVLPEGIPAGVYQVGVKVYAWSPEGITVMPTAIGEEYAVIGTVEVID